MISGSSDIRYKGILQSQGGHCYCCQGAEYNGTNYPQSFIPYYSPLTGTLVGLFCRTCISLIKYESKYDAYRTRMAGLKDRLNRIHQSNFNEDRYQLNINRWTRIVNIVDKIERRVSTNPD